MPETNPAAPQPQPLSPMFMWTELKGTQHDFTRRIDALNIRLDQLDQHGTRGVEGLRSEVTQLSRDMEQHEAQHERSRVEQVSRNRWLVGVVVACVVPLYPLLGYVVVRLARG